VNKGMYFNIRCRLRVVVRWKRSGKCRTNCWFLLQDNIPEHQSVMTKDLLGKNNVTTLGHPQYSRDLDSADFHLFPRLKLTLKG